MKRRLIAVGLVGMAGSAYAGDVTMAPAIVGSATPVVADILGGAEPGALKVDGITVYGAIDTNLAWQTHGVRTSASYYNGMEYQINKNSQGSLFAVTNNAAQASFVGVKGTQSLDDLTGIRSLEGWSLGFDLQAGFDPVFGPVADNLKSLRQNNGVSPSSQTANGDGARAGQIFNAEAYGAIKNTMLGELRYGRNNTLLYDAVGIYDPQKLSYANSLLSSGTFGGGYGATEDTRWNNSFKYINSFGPMRVGAQYRFAGSGEGGQAYSLAGALDLSGQLKGLSIDAVWGHQDDAIAASSLTSSTAIIPALGSCQSLGISLAACRGINVLNATVSDNTAWALMAKYNFETFQLANLTVYGGYERIDYSNPSSQLDTLNTIGGYVINPTGVNYNAYTMQKHLDVTWIAGQYYFTPKLKAIGAWYHLKQNAFQTTALGANAPTRCTNPGQGVSSQSNCAGSLNWVSAMLDYQWTKRLDVYGGVSFTQAQDGLASGFAHTSTLNTTLGARFRF